MRVVPTCEAPGDTPREPRPVDECFLRLVQMTMNCRRRVGDPSQGPPLAASSRAAKVA
jgi:hypothetical protein